MKNKKSKNKNKNKNYLDVTSESILDDKSKFIIDIKNNRFNNSTHILVDCENGTFSFIYKDDENIVISRDLKNAVESAL